MSDERMRRRARARAALQSTDNALLKVDAVREAVRQAQGRMSEIIEDARAFRTRSDAKLETISDHALRSSVDPFAKQRMPRHGIAPNLAIDRE